MIFAVLLHVQVLVCMLTAIIVEGSFIPERRDLARSDTSSSPSSGRSSSIWTSDSTLSAASRSNLTALSTSVGTTNSLLSWTITSSSDVVSKSTTPSSAASAARELSSIELNIASQDSTSKVASTNFAIAPLPLGKLPDSLANSGGNASHAISTVSAVIVPIGPQITSAATLPTNSTATPSLWSTDWFTFSIATCPTTFPPDAAIQFRTDLPICEMMQQDSDWKLNEYADICLRQYCEYQYTSLMYDFISLTRTGGPRYETITEVDWQGLVSIGSTTIVVTAISVWTTTYTVPLDAFAAVSTVEAPCCGTCYLSAETIQLLWWPPVTDQLTATPVITGLPPNATVAVTGLPIIGDGTYVDDTGFTFRSPSVYLAFTSLGGHNSCGFLGEPIYNTTIGFDPDEISSLNSPEPFTVCTTTHKQVVKSYTWTWTNINTDTATAYNIVTQKVEYEDIAQDCSLIPEYSFFANNPGNWLRKLGDPCHPVIAIPERVKTLRPEWASCGGETQRGGFFDPPSTLHQGFYLVPTTASPGPGTPTLPPKTLHPTTSLPIETSDPPASHLSPTVSHPEETPTPASSSRLQQEPSSRGGSTTTIVITPALPDPTSKDPRPPVTLPPVLTLSLQSDPGAPNEPASSGGDVVTLIPTIIPPSNAPGAPSDSNQPSPSQAPRPNDPSPSTTAVIIGTQTLLPGSTITVGGSTSTLSDGQITVVGGTQVILDPSGTQLLVGGSSTLILPHPTRPAAPAIATVGTNLIAANGGSPIVIGSQTLLPGGIITIDGTTLSLAPDASQLVVDGSTISLPAPTNPPTAPRLLTLGTQTQTLTADSLNQFILPDGETLIPGGPALTISGTTLALARDSLTVLMNGTPVPLSPAITTAPVPLVLTIGDRMLTADAQTHFTISGQTLSLYGPALTVDGTTWYMTTDAEGRTVVIAGTAGPSAVAAATTMGMDSVTLSRMAVVEGGETVAGGAAAATTSRKGAGVRNGVGLRGIGGVVGVILVAFGGV